MVAKAGKNWKLAPSLVALVDEINKSYPKRKKASDGSIGDAAHQARASDHNPYQGYVHAVDITYDKDSDFNVHEYAKYLAAVKDPRINYIISNGMIWKSRTGKWEIYRLANKHTSHVHFSIHRTPAARNDTSSWLSITPSRPVSNKDKVGQGKVPEPVAFEGGEVMKLYRDHTGAVWLWYKDDTRVHISNPDEVEVWKNWYGLQMLDFGPGSPFHNEIISNVWLNRVSVRK